LHDNAAVLDADTLRVCENADLIVAGSLGEHRAAHRMTMAAQDLNKVQKTLRA